MTKTLITGGTGKTGGRVVQRLLERGQPVRVASRSGQAPEGAEGVRFDWSQPAGHAAALEGIDRVYLVSPPLEEDSTPLMTEFIARARHVGVRRFVLLSASSVPEGGPLMGGIHRLLHETAPEWTVLRPTWFMQNFSEGLHALSLQQEGALYSATGEGRVPFIDAGDIAEVAVRALLDARAHNTDHVLTGPQALNYGEVARIIGAALGKPVRHVAETREALTARLVHLGIPPGYASALAGMDEAISRGAEDRVTPDVEQVTGRSPRSFEDFARETLGVR